MRIASPLPALAAEKILASPDRLEVNASCGPVKILKAARTEDLPFFSKPSWLSELSLDVEECYDSNVYLSGVDHQFVPPSFAAPSGSAVARKDRSSFVTTVSPRIGLDLTPLFGGGKTLQVFSLAYEPSFAIYHGESDESNDAHRLISELKAGGDSFFFDLGGSLRFVDGERMAPTYPGGFENAGAPTGPRDRRKQLNGQAAADFEYDLGPWFLRPIASYLFWDMKTKQEDVEGYQNYVDRSEVAGGSDVGYRLSSRFAITLGYRYGHQFQEKLRFRELQSNNDFQRVLVGLEGKPWSWLDMKVQLGPDFRDYASNAPLNHQDRVTYYGQGSITATPTERDRLTFTFNEWLWTSQLGQIPYFDSRYALSYTRTLVEDLDVEIGGIAHRYDYTIGDAPNSARDDLEYVAFAGMYYALGSHGSVDLTYAFDGGRNLLDHVDNGSTRAFERHLVTLKARVTF